LTLDIWENENNKEIARLTSLESEWFKWFQSNKEYDCLGDVLDVMKQLADVVVVVLETFDRLNDQEKAGAEDLGLYLKNDR
jgi:hypothetical protein